MYPFNRIVLASTALVLTVTAQNVSVGIIGGISPGDDYRSSLNPHYAEHPFTHTIGYPIGLSLELGLTRNFSLEVDGIYRQLHFPDGPGSVVTWQVPVLAKYRFVFGPMKPFIEAGPSFRAAGNLNGTSPSPYGATAGAGLSFKVSRFKIEPTVRYTHWGNERANTYQSEVPNRVEFLVGVSTAMGGGPASWRPFGRRLSIGAVAGMTLTKDFQNGGGTFTEVTTGPQWTIVNGSGPQSFIAGPMIELELWRQFSIEADGIYRPLRDSTYVLPPPGGLLNPRSSLNSGSAKTITWEFPVLAKYRFGARRLKPLVEAGPSFRPPIHVHGPAISPFGVTAGAGVEGKWGPLRISPVVRYTHWGRDSSNGAGDVRSNEAVALVGFSF